MTLEEFGFTLDAEYRELCLEMEFTNGNSWYGAERFLKIVEVEAVLDDWLSLVQLHRMMLAPDFVKYQKSHPAYYGA